jgi:hypothetical protein
MDGGTHIVEETRKSQRLGPCPAADDVCSLDDEHTSI